MRSLLLALLVLVWCGCGGSGSNMPPAAPPPGGGGGPGNGTPPSPAPAPIPGLIVDSSVTAQVVVSGLQTPDDIAVAPDGTIYVGDETRGVLSAWSPSSGQTRVVTSTLSHPEGIVALNGLLVVCEQGKNRLSRVDPGSGSVTLFRSLPNPTANLGVDGLGYDPLDPSIIVPDSPNGTLERASLDGTTATPIPVTGAGQPPFVRPTGAFVRSDGTILVADEFGGEVMLRRTDGSLVTVRTGLRSPDDVLGDAQGDVYVNTLDDGVLHRLQGNADQKLVSGLQAPHGLAFDLDGNVLVTDLGGGGRVIKVFVR